MHRDSLRSDMFNANTIVGDFYDSRFGMNANEVVFAVLVPQNSLDVTRGDIAGTFGARSRSAIRTSNAMTFF